MVEAYPERKFLELSGREVPDRFQGDQEERRLFFHLAAAVELKGPGRITLPKRLLAYFPSRVVRVAGMNDYLELWDPDTWEAQVARQGAAFPLPGEPGPQG
jgi:DNA-binding transcriptional regulator/RsmH inhibitor MraZ